MVIPSMVTIYIIYIGFDPSPDYQRLIQMITGPSWLPLEHHTTLEKNFSDQMEIKFLRWYHVLPQYK